MPATRKHNEEELEHLVKKRLVKRYAKKRKRMPVHGAGLKKIARIWQKRLQSDR
jgi:hypothetical protein